MTPEFTALKQSRWVKVHEPGQVNYDYTKDVINVVVGRCLAEVTYSTEKVKSCKDAAHWIFQSLEVAGAADIVARASEYVKAAAENANREVAVAVDDWNCEISRATDGVFRVRLEWTPDEPVIKKKA
jgi:hypothetical protein